MPIHLPFEIGQVLSRKKIHQLLGGQERNGISTPVADSWILLFTGERGEEFGYEDSWEGDVFHYTGEGQRGDMQSIRGNKAVRDHKENGERILLFKERPDHNQEFIGEMAVRGWRNEPQKDMTGKIRQAIVFELVRVE